MQDNIKINQNKLQEIQEGFNSLAMLISENDSFFLEAMEQSPNFYNALMTELYNKNGEIGGELVKLNYQVKSLLVSLMSIVESR